MILKNLREADLPGSYVRPKLGLEESRLHFATTHQIFEKEEKRKKGTHGNHSTFGMVPVKVTHIAVLRFPRFSPSRC